ncbi:hypothetical protein LZK98_18225 [Sphingomonas cannabina]|uniref:hypothetical protein n=1 Tax=Sphingomonas cannabina TaxID=2899123 RepID=UPI001F3C2A1D|nr:hypothetical protein [Sphingomonas cannabina]UIJ44964.1 hypothetical protein LZK98_18225 [Sphingomonas cannabina]
MWFNPGNAVLGLLFFAAFTAGSAWIAFDLYRHPDQILPDRAAWMALGHGLAGMVAGSTLALLCLRYTIAMVRRLTTDKPAIRQTEEGVQIHGLFGVGRNVPLNEIVSVKVRRIDLGVWSILLWGSKSYELSLVLSGTTWLGTKRKLTLPSGAVFGGLPELCRFAESLDRRVSPEYYRQVDANSASSG